MTSDPWGASRMRRTTPVFSHCWPDCNLIVPSTYLLPFCPLLFLSHLSSCLAFFLSSIICHDVEWMKIKLGGIRLHGGSCPGCHFLHPHRLCPVAVHIQPRWNKLSQGSHPITLNLKPLCWCWSSSISPLISTKWDKWWVITAPVTKTAWNQSQLRWWNNFFFLFHFHFCLLTCNCYQKGCFCERFSHLRTYFLTERKDFQFNYSQAVSYNWAQLLLFLYPDVFYIFKLKLARITSLICKRFVRLHTAPSEAHKSLCTNSFSCVQRKLTSKISPSTWQSVPKNIRENVWNTGWQIWFRFRKWCQVSMLRRERQQPALWPLCKLERRAVGLDRDEELGW